METAVRGPRSRGERRCRAARAFLAAYSERGLTLSPPGAARRSTRFISKAAVTFQREPSRRQARSTSPGKIVRVPRLRMGTPNPTPSSERSWSPS